jgi:transketolase
MGHEAKHPSDTASICLDEISRRIRGRIIELSHRSKTPHLGGSLSCVDILTAAYWSFLKIDPQNPANPDRDRFILSKGHAALALFTTLAERGFFSQSILDTFAQPGSSLEEHPSLGSAPGVEASSGSLGHGLPIGLGMALAARIQKRPYRVLVVMSDGECEEGSVWEAAMFAPIHGLDNLITVIDYNKWQATGRSNEIMALESLAQKWEAFGWRTYQVDGNDLKALVDLFQLLPDGSGKPSAIIANTIKGKGVSFMEDDNNWHYRIPTLEEVTAAKKELGLL